MCCFFKNNKVPSESEVVGKLSFKVRKTATSPRSGRKEFLGIETVKSNTLERSFGWLHRPHFPFGKVALSF